MKNGLGAILSSIAQETLCRKPLLTLLNCQKKNTLLFKKNIIAAITDNLILKNYLKENTNLNKGEKLKLIIL